MSELPFSDNTPVLCTVEVLEWYLGVPVARGEYGDTVSGSVDALMNALCVGSADMERACRWTHSTFQKPDKLLWTAGPL